MAHDLNIPAIADGQADGQWQTSNDGDAAIGNALADQYLVDFSAGNVTLTTTQYRSAMTFKPSAALVAARTLIVPAVKRPFVFHNPDATYTVTLKKTDGGSPEVATTIAVAAGQIFYGYTDGTASGLFGSAIATGVAPSGDVVGPASSTNNAFAQFNGTTGKLLKNGMLKATDAQVRAATADTVLTSDLIESASALVTLTDAANISLDWDAGITRALTIGGNRTLDNATNGQPGTWRTIIITQDGTGTRTLAYGNQYKFPGGTEPVLTTAAGSVDVLNILCVTASNFYVFSANDMKV